MKILFTYWYFRNIAFLYIGETTMAELSSPAGFSAVIMQYKKTFFSWTFPVVSINMAAVSVNELFIGHYLPSSHASKAHFTYISLSPQSYYYWNLLAEAIQSKQVCLLVLFSILKCFLTEKTNGLKAAFLNWQVSMNDHSVSGGHR